MILGKNLIMTLGDMNRGLAANKSCELSTDTEFLDICSPVEGDWKEVIPTINSWSTSADSLVASLADHTTLLKKQINKEKLVCCFFDRELQAFYKGYCYIGGLQIKATVGSLASMSVRIKPTGGLELADEVEISMDEGETENNVSLTFNEETNEVTVVRKTGYNVLTQQITIDNDTRITLGGRGVVVNASYSDVRIMLINEDSAALNAAAVLINSVEDEKSVIIKKQSESFPVYVLVNSANGKDIVKYLSKF